MPANADPERSGRAFQFTLREMLLGMTLFGVLCGSAVHFESPTLFVVGLLWPPAWLAWKTGRISTLGIALATAGLAVLIRTASSHYEMMDRVMFGDFVMSMGYQLGTLLAVAAICTFLICGATGLAGRRFWNNAAASAVAIVLILYFFVASPVIGRLREARLATINADNAAKMQQAISEVHAICKRLGRAPLDEPQLVRLLGKPMPILSGHAGLSAEIRYVRSGQNSFQLVFFDGDIYTYDSQLPASGWTVTPF